MIGLLGQIIIYVGGAFVLGVVVSWMFWRAGRHSITNDSWDDTEREADHLRKRVVTLESEQHQLESGMRDRADELERLQSVLGETWDALAERDKRIVEENAELVALREAHSASVERAERLQRRVAELAVETSRLSGVDPASILGNQR